MQVTPQGLLLFFAEPDQLGLESASLVHFAAELVRRALQRLVALAHPPLELGVRGAHPCCA